MASPRDAPACDVPEGAALRQEDRLRERDNAGRECLARVALDPVGFDLDPAHRAHGDVADDVAYRARFVPCLPPGVCVVCACAAFAVLVRTHVRVLSGCSGEGSPSGLPG